ncbi:hypothetical protein HSRCO_0144 [Halanaeroarchaeum sp. HSR-CO]|uniref:hypothetical protein n=1 Tax=Halanaeroarchaeum sp. HSR-CO TaxID=2866382 RepID=UPI00217E63C8|nr:hypothetical protein [Halanaeroarchaeum sp. HSR-CO]UWG46446.1 hypothetical protein HSRCO_0144 [Halanaeroarchaeum sp. HSR-CO]
MSCPLARRPLAFFRSVATPAAGPDPATGCDGPTGRVGDDWPGIGSLATGYRGPLKT